MSVLFYDGVDHMIEKITTLIKGKANNSHKHGNGDITSLDAGKITSGTISIDRLPHGALDRLIKVVDDTARFKLTTKDVQLGDSVKVTSTKKMYIVVDETKLSSEDGYEPYTADSATSVPWSGVTGKPNTYTPSSHTHDDRYYTESEMDTKLGEKVDLSEDGVSNAINKLSIGTDIPSDADYYVSQYAGGGGINTTYHRRPVSALWSYIKSKADKVYASSSHTHSYLPLSGGTITGDVTVTGILKGENDGHTNHALLLGHNAQDYMNFYEYGGLFQFYKSQSGTDTLLGKISVDGWEGKVNGHTVNADVPSGAKFTDTDTWRPQPDWNATSGDAVILNKPTIPEEIVVDTALSSTSTNPVQNKVVNTEFDKKADKEKYGDTIVSVGRKPDSTIGDNSFAFGNDITASRAYSHAEGDSTTASGGSSHAEGYRTTASGNFSHAEGGSTTASGAYSHAEGEWTTALNNSHAEGYNTKALSHQHAQGHYNNTTTATSNSPEGASTGTAFVIGNGTSKSNSNAFRITSDGYVYATNAAVQTGADYAEYFEWSDGNPDNEDRVGLFVTFDENNQEKIRIANSDDDYILGIVSGMPSVIGNGDEDWKKRYVLDDFGRYIQETFEYVIDGETKTGTKWKENPEYDSTKPYASRDERAEWSAIGLVGMLSVYDDGTCQVNGYCKCENNGIATASEKGTDTYRVIKRVTDNIVKVVLK